MDNGKIGTRIKNFRERKGWSIDELAQRAKLDASFVDAVESGSVKPALGMMVKLARALGTRLGTFMDDELTTDPLIVRLADRKEETVAHASGKNSPDMVYYHLGRGKADRSMEPFFIRLEPSADEPKLSSHEGEEFIVVVSGEVQLVYGNETHVLGPGDSMYYNSVVPHFVGAHGASEAEIYAVVYVPA
ncbi:transcriptional regulator with XRE-family HTH domain [Desulfobaculum xiamenense]|uniref:Transcriptional regulator with XRE-family HTH domain n=1 Tax=Desulfobaculum xiamenense TaxID=995050 RepID=A0A846QU56_9BACT|nr:XRE family transcriptional regulator [Desulfobaculum xiamenense]NJB69025.1 transcriptional regulator with XRE-family HTH domain [Desulfobaculum xiamenense]